MATLICSTCGSDDELNLSTIPDDCGSVDFGFPYGIVLQSKDATNTFAGIAPSVQELEQLALLQNDNKKVIFIMPLTNGQKTEKARFSQSGADTIDGLETVYNQTIQIQGRLKLLDETLLSDLAKLNCYTRVRMWLITSKGYIFGGTTGFIVPNFISEVIMEGFGTADYIPFSYEYVVDRQTDYSATLKDMNYLTLAN